MNFSFLIQRFVFLNLAVCLSGCSALLTGLYGIKEPKYVDTKTIARYAKKYAIPGADSFELDTAYYSFLAALDTNRYKTHIKNHLQPLQALYYNKSGQLQSFQVNCYAGGFPNLNWNRNGNMAVFPPKQQAPPDSIVPLSAQLKYLKPLPQSVVAVKGANDWIVVVYWSRFMGRQSKRLIRVVQQNSKLAGDERVKILYVNTDNLFVKNE